MKDFVRISETPTPYAVHCWQCGKVYLTYEEYTWQMWDANHLWCCPCCGETAHWDDDNFELYSEQPNYLVEDEQ